MNRSLSVLATQFEKAGIPLHISREGIVRNLRGGGSIVQMDIQRTRKGNRVREEVRLSPGEGADLRVLGIDKKLHQLVLLVREPERTFSERVWVGGKVGWRTVERKTVPDPRRFLIGQDESHLFIAQLSDRATSVRDAHRQLRPADLPAKTKVRRQGEWFFTPASADEVAEIDPHRVLRNVGIGGQRQMRGRPHVVSKLVRVGGVELVRGRVRHPDHKTVELRGWHRVRMNTEDRSAGATWVD